MNSSTILLKCGLLCLKLTNDYRAHTKFILDRREKQEGLTPSMEFKRREMNNSLDIGSFILDNHSKKYHRIYQINDSDGLDLHALVDNSTGIVYKPKSNGYANKNLSWDINQCIRVADWRGYYLNADPVI